MLFRSFKNPFRTEYQVVNVASLAKLFEAGATVDVAALVAAGAVRKGQPVKVLGQGDITIALHVTADKFSQSAIDKITAAGGTANAQ